MAALLERSQLFKLDHQRRPVRCDDMKEWALHMEESHRVGETRVHGIRVSTVFMGLGGPIEGKPLPFETVLFRGDTPLKERGRYATWKEAEAGHEAWVQRVRDGRVRAR